jgi:hypothetical protein
VEKIKKAQKLDLFFLINLKNLSLLILIPKLSDKNKYYFNLILDAKLEFNIKKFYNFSFNFVILKSVTWLNIFNLSESYVKNKIMFKRVYAHLY